MRSCSSAQPRSRRAPTARGRQLRRPRTCLSHFQRAFDRIGLFVDKGQKRTRRRFGRPAPPLPIVDRRPTETETASKSDLRKAQLTTHGCHVDAFRDLELTHNRTPATTDVSGCLARSPDDFVSAHSLSPTVATMVSGNRSRAAACSQPRHATPDGGYTSLRRNPATSTTGSAQVSATASHSSGDFAPRARMPSLLSSRSREWLSTAACVSACGQNATSEPLRSWMVAEHPTPLVPAVPTL